MLRPPIDGADPSTSAHHRSLNLVPVFIRVFHRARNLLNLSPAPAGQVIPSLLFPSLVVQNKVDTDSGTDLALLRACRYSGSSGKTSGGNGSGDGSGGDGGDDSGGDHDGGCDDDGGGGGRGGGGDNGCFGGNSSSLQT